jgi:hypothetical protein
VKVNLKFIEMEGARDAFDAVTPRPEYFFSHSHFPIGTPRFRGFPRDREQSSLNDVASGSIVTRADIFDVSLLTVEAKGLRFLLWFCLTGRFLTVMSSARETFEWGDNDGHRGIHVMNARVTRENE